MATRGRWPAGSCSRWACCSATARRSSPCRSWPWRWTERAWRRLALVAVGGTVGLMLPLLVGFSWLAGLIETNHRSHHSLARARGYRYWLLGNAATFAGLVGPATFAGLRRLRAAPGRVLVLAGLACPVLAGLSGRSSAETERIWQPFAAGAPGGRLPLVAAG